MKIFALFASAVLLALGVLACGMRGTHAGSISGNSSASSSRRPELEYFKAINRTGPAQDPQILFLLMAQYSSANLQNDGVDFISGRLQEFGPRLIFL